MVVTVLLGYPAVSPKVLRPMPYELSSYKRTQCQPNVNTLIQIQCDSNSENNTCNATCDGNGEDTTVTSKEPDSWSFVCCVVVSFQSKVIQITNQVN